MKYDPMSRKNPPQCDPECEKDRLARVEAEQREQDRKDITDWSQGGHPGTEIRPNRANSRPFTAGWEFPPKCW